MNKNIKAQHEKASEDWGTAEQYALAYVDVITSFGRDREDLDFLKKEQEHRLKGAQEATDRNTKKTLSFAKKLFNAPLDTTVKIYI